jgi:hypothetical protein
MIFECSFCGNRWFYRNAKRRCNKCGRRNVMRRIVLLNGYQEMVIGE